MIKKERLEELIEQGATIYVVNNKVVFEEKLNKHHTHDVLKDCVCWWSIPRKRWFFKDCFETKEDAEEYAEFGEVKKEIKFPFVDWQTLKHDFIDNPKSSGTYVVFEFDNYSLDIVVCHTGDIDISVYEKDFYKPLTRENYNEARRLCVKLFKGEE